jgi:hypothetical protein
MAIYLGNLTTSEMESRLGISLTTEDREKLESIRSNTAKVTNTDKWHCFDIPFVLVCGNYDTAVLVHSILEPYSGDMNQKLKIALDSK